MKKMGQASCANTTGNALLRGCTLQYMKAGMSASRRKERPHRMRGDFRYLFQQPATTLPEKSDALKSRKQATGVKNFVPQAEVLSMERTLAIVDGKMDRVVKKIVNTLSAWGKISFHIRHRRIASLSHGVASLHSDASEIKTLASSEGIAAISLEYVVSCDCFR